MTDSVSSPRNPGERMKVCVVIEQPRKGPAASGVLYGVFATEEAARQDYGAEDDAYKPWFIMCEVQ